MALLVGPSLLSAFPAQQAVPAGERIFEPVHAVSPPSMPTGMTCSPGGRFLYAGEGASIAVLDTEISEWWKSPVKVFTLSSLGIVPVAMVLDPDAAVEDIEPSDPPGSEDLLYVAAGRDGLWVVHADPRAGKPNPAFRADDSPDGNPTDQSGRRWASALDFVTVDGTEFLAVLFAAKDDSYLRLYELQDLRDLANDQSSMETGSEIAPARNISLNQSLQPHIDYWHSYAFGLAVDQEGSVEGGADIYVAHGAHGLVRVRLYPNVSSPFPEIDLEIGPWFGDDSAYADSATGPGIGFGTTQIPWDHRVYDDLKYIDRSHCPGACAKVERSHPPIFTDVAYHAGFLYATVESAGWVRFDLSQSWGPAMAIDHHEGWQNRILLHAGSSCSSPCGDPPETDEEILLGLVDDNGIQRTWTRRIVVSETDGGPVLAVTAGPEQMASVTNVAEQRHEGRTHNDPLPNAAAAGMGGDSTFTLLYHLGCGGFAAGQENHEIVVKRGGDQVLVPPEQGVDFCHETEPDDVVFFASSRKKAFQGITFLDGFEEGAGDPGQSFSTYWVKASWNGSIVAEATRDKTHRPGWLTRYATVSRLDESILFGGNDGGMVLPGVHWTCGGEFLSGPPPAFPLDPLDVANLHTSVLVNGEAQWLPAPGTFQGQAYFWRAMAGQNGTSWSMWRYSIGRNLCDANTVYPVREKSLIIDLPNDRFGVPGRRHYLPGAISEVYDAHFQAHANEPGATLVFAVRSGTDWGIVIMRRDDLQAIMDNPGTGDGHEVEDPVAEGVIVATLVTAPELAGVLSPGPPSNAPTTNFVQGNDLSRPTSNFSPRFFTLYDGDQDPPVRQMLAIPAGQVSVKPDDPFMSPPGFTFPVPSPYDIRYRHLKVCIFDITDTQYLTEDGSPFIPAWTILGPRIGFAADLQVREIEGKTWMFVVDFTGELLLYDISDILDEPQGGLDHTTFPPAAAFAVSADLTDQFRSDAYSVAVEEVEWDDGGQPRPQLYAYLGASRVGIEVFRLRPEGQPQAGLVRLGIVQVPGEAEGLWIRKDPDDEEKTQLVVCNTYGGIRILKRRPPLE